MSQNRTSPHNRFPQRRELNPQVLKNGRIAHACTLEQKTYEQVFFLATVLDQSIASVIGELVEAQIGEALKAHGLESKKASLDSDAKRRAALEAEASECKAKFLSTGEFHHAERLAEIRKELKAL
jgi:hypothetical protein